MKRYVDADELRENIYNRINNPAIRAWLNKLIDDTTLRLIQYVLYIINIANTLWFRICAVNVRKHIFGGGLL